MDISYQLMFLIGRFKVLQTCIVFGIIFKADNIDFSSVDDTKSSVDLEHKIISLFSLMDMQ